MACRVVVAGGREFTPTQPQEAYVLSLLRENQATEIVSGGCRGADAMGVRLAGVLGIPVKTFLADWNKYGKSAGPLRNREMAVYADLAIILPGGRGTHSMLMEASRAGKRIITVGDVE